MGVFVAGVPSSLAHRTPFFSLCPSPSSFTPATQAKSNQIFEAAIVELKRQGFGKVDHHIPISKEDLNKIQSSYNPSSPDPKSLQQVVWFNIMFHLIRRGRENLRLLTKESFAVQVDAAGKKFVYQVVDELDKHHRVNDQPDDSPGEGRMYERPESPYCPL